MSSSSELEIDVENSFSDVFPFFILTEENVKQVIQQQFTEFVAQKPKGDFLVDISWLWVCIILQENIRNPELCDKISKLNRNYRFPLHFRKLYRRIKLFVKILKNKLGYRARFHNDQLMKGVEKYQSLSPMWKSNHLSFAFDNMLYSLIPEKRSEDWRFFHFVPTWMTEIIQVPVPNPLSLDCVLDKKDNSLKKTVDNMTLCFKWVFLFISNYPLYQFSKSSFENQHAGMSFSFFFDHVEKIPKKALSTIKNTIIWPLNDRRIFLGQLWDMLVHTQTQGNPLKFSPPEEMEQQIALQKIHHSSASETFWKETTESYGIVLPGLTGENLNLSVFAQMYPALFFESLFNKYQNFQREVRAMVIVQKLEGKMTTEENEDFDEEESLFWEEIIKPSLLRVMDPELEIQELFSVFTSRLTEFLAHLGMVERESEIMVRQQQVKNTQLGLSIFIRYILNFIEAGAEFLSTAERESFAGGCFSWIAQFSGRPDQFGNLEQLEKILVLTASFLRVLCTQIFDREKDLSPEILLTLLCNRNQQVSTLQNMSWEVWKTRSAEELLVSSYVALRSWWVQWRESRLYPRKLQK